MNEKLQKIIARINQLRAISKSTHSRAESETTASLAAKLIAEYQLSEAVIEQETGSINDPLDLEGEHIIYESGRKTLWKYNLAYGLASLNGLFAYNARVRGGKSHRLVTRIRVIGKKSNIEIALYMFDYLLREIEMLADAWIVGRGKRGVNPEREIFCYGCVDGFLGKMRAEKAAVLASNSTAMVLIGNQAKEAEEAFVKKTGIVLRAENYNPRSSGSSNSYSLGQEKGRDINVSSGMGSSGKNTKLLG